ncbi:Cof-type HAD-IIB family hydrolase [Alkalihalobacterium sp. APHAB7]|uniref:Cof-type HAD-IIB family hydrolase n=1 Tax=Alkalihalobacterium sp. APHAB7 TaxID=3402081 RepID=UPI003AAA3ACE
MPDVKAIVLDLDGTLLDKSGVVSRRNKDYLLEQKEQGVKIILATGRPINMTVAIHEQLQLNTPMICLNGAVVYDREIQQVVNDEPMGNHLVDEVYDKVTDHAELIISHTSKYNYQVHSKQGNSLFDMWGLANEDVCKDEPILKIMVDFESPRIARDLASQINPQLQIINWGDSVEITKKPVTKWHSLKRILDEYGIDPKETAAFGDGPNDVEMLRNVGIGVAMGNGLIEVKRATKFVTTSHEEDGVTEFLYHYQNKSHLTI